MDIGFDTATILTGLLIFCARVFDVTMGTLRTISTVQGRTKVAFFLGLVEITTWVFVISTVIKDVKDRPLLGVFYALGFATGNVVGIMVEQRLALGRAAVRVISAMHGRAIAEQVRRIGLQVTMFPGEGREGPVNLIFVVCERRRVGEVLGVLKRIEPDAFYTVDMVGPTGKAARPVGQPATGWRAIMKRK